MKKLANIVFAAGLLSSAAIAQDLVQPNEPMAQHSIAQDADLLSIASAGALSSSSVGVQLLSASEAQEVQGGKSIFKKIRDWIRNPLRFPPVRK